MKLKPSMLVLLAFCTGCMAPTSMSIKHEPKSESGFVEIDYVAWDQFGTYLDLHPMLHLSHGGKEIFLGDFTSEGMFALVRKLRVARIIEADPGAYTLTYQLGLLDKKQTLDFDVKENRISPIFITNEIYLDDKGLKNWRQEVKVLGDFPTEKSPGYRDSLEEALKNPDVGVRMLAIDRISQLGDVNKMAEICNEPKDPDFRIERMKKLSCKKFK